MTTSDIEKESRIARGMTVHEVGMNGNAKVLDYWSLPGSPMMVKIAYYRKRSGKLLCTRVVTINNIEMV